MGLRVAPSTAAVQASATCHFDGALPQPYPEIRAEGPAPKEAVLASPIVQTPSKGVTYIYIHIYIDMYVYTRIIWDPFKKNYSAVSKES